MVSSLKDDFIFLFDPYMGPQLVQPLLVNVDMGVMAMKGVLHILLNWGLSI